MPHGESPAVFDDMEKAHEIGADIVLRRLQGMAHPRLRRQMGHEAGPVGFERKPHRLPIGDIPLCEVEARKLAQLRETGLFQGCVIISVEIVEAHDPAARFEEASCEVKADEPGRARHQNGRLPQGFDRRLGRLLARVLSAHGVDSRSKPACRGKGRADQYPQTP